MCKASITARNTITAVIGAAYGIGISNHGLGAFHPPEQKVADCVACVQNGTRVTFSNIPPAIQEKFDLGDHATGTFIDYGDNAHDEVKFDNGAEAVLCELANRGIVACVGEGAASAGPEDESETDHNVNDRIDGERELEPA